VAAAGTGNTPCAISPCPPTLRGEQADASHRPSRGNTMPQFMIESSAPTSCKCTFSTAFDGSTPRLRRVAETWPWRVPDLLETVRTYR